MGTEAKIRNKATEASITLKLDASRIN